MAVQFILGSAGSGKSHKLYTIMTDRSAANPQVEYVALVPEQYSMESQKEIVSIHKNKGAFNTEVVSFNRLALRTFEEVGMDNLSVIDEMGKLLIIRKVLEDCKKNLKVYSTKISMPGFVDKIKSTISEFEQYGVGVTELKSMIDTSEKKKSLKIKLADVSLIYEGFKKYMNENLATSEEVLERLCSVIPKSDKIKNSEFFIDGYTGFTPIQKKVVFLLIKYAKNVTFAFNLPESETNFERVSEQDLFLLSKKTIIQIKDECRRTRVEILDDIVVRNIDGRPYRLKNSAELSFIEQNIFRYKASEKFEEKTVDVSVHSISNPRRECEFVAKTILKMMEDDDSYKFRDFAVISGDLENYYRYMEEAFSNYNINGFIDYKRSVSSNPYVMAVLGVLEIIDKDFTYDSVFHFISLGVMNNIIEDILEKAQEDVEEELTISTQGIIDKMDNYVLMSGRRGIKSYSKKWERIYRGFAEEELEVINLIRESLVELITPLKTSLKQKNATVLDRTKALYEFIKKLDMFAMISKDAKEFEESGEQARALEYKGVYDAVIDTFDKLVAMLGNEVLSFKEYKGLVETGLGNLKVGIVPPSYDSVMVGDIERTRLKDIKKVIFVIGANDGIIPKHSSGVGIISDLEREFLSQNSFELAPTARENVFTQRLYLYMALTKPSDKLIISYSKSDINGDEIRKSYIINTLEELFANLSKRDEDKFEYDASNIVNYRDCIKFIAHFINKSKFSESTDEFYQIYSLMIENEEFRTRIFNMIDAAFYTRNAEELEKDIAKKLYGLRDNISVTRIEKFAACAYAHFIENGLKLNQRRQYELAAYDLGNLYHGAIDGVFRICRDEEVNICDLTDDEKAGVIARSVDKVMENFDTDILTSTARYKYLAGRVRTVTESTVDVLTSHLKKGEYEPRYNEYSIEHGRVDRVDVFENESDMYIKVIDYKTGSKKFDFTDVFYGLQLQLLVYTNDVVKKEQKKHPEKSVHPGGAFYYCIQDPLIDKPDFDRWINILKKEDEYKSMSDEKLKEIIAFLSKEEMFKLSGLVNSSEESLKAIDTEMFEQRGTSIVVPVSFKKDGTLSSTSLAFDEEKFNAVLGYAEDLTEKMKDKILDGCISVNPYEDSCKYCQYRGICRFDTALGDCYREKQKIKKDDIISLIYESKEDEKIEEGE